MGENQGSALTPSANNPSGKDSVLNPHSDGVLTAYEKKESLANDKSTDTATTSLGGDTALSQTKESAAKIDNSSETAKENGEKFSLKDEIKAVSQQFGVDKAEVTSVPKAHGEIGGSEVLVTYDKKITPKQQELLRGLNFHEYPTIQELSAAKISNNSETAKENGEKFSLKDEKNCWF